MAWIMGIKKQGLHIPNIASTSLRSIFIIEPAVFGIVRPALLWPTRLSERLSDQEVDAILAHELSRRARGRQLALERCAGELERIAANLAPRSL